MELIEGDIRRVRDLLGSGANVMVAGKPSSGKTTLLADLLVEDPQMLVLAGNSRAARAIQDKALDFCHRHGKARIIGTARSFGGEVFARFNQWRTSQGLPEIRLATDAEILAKITDVLQGIKVEPELEDALETRGFRREIVDSIFRVRAWEACGQAIPETVHPLVNRLAAALNADLETSRVQARESAWPLDTASLFTEYLRSLQEGATVPTIVGVDDLQNCDGFMIEVLLAWASRGTQLVTCTLPETRVNTFRGASPILVRHLSDTLRDLPGKNVDELCLNGEYVPESLRRLWQTAVERLGVNGLSARLWAPREGEVETGADKASSEGDERNQAITLVEQSTDSAQYREIGAILQEAHIFGQTPLNYSEMAVLTRTASEARQIAQVLENMEIPVVVPGVTTQLNEGRITGPLLKMMAVVCTDSSMPRVQDLDLIEILGSPMVGWNAWRMREADRLLQKYVPRPSPQDQEVAGDTVTPVSSKNPDTATTAQSDDTAAGILYHVRQFIAAVMTDADFWGHKVEDMVEDEPSFSILQRIGTALSASFRTWVKDPGSTQVVLWKLWDGLECGESLRAKALTPGLEGTVRTTLQTDLDLVVDLFKAADWFEARNPGKTAADFAAGMLEQSLPTGTVAPHHLVKDAVTVTPAASTVSQHWPLVVAAGLSDGNWPQMRWPGSVLGATMFELESEAQTENSSKAGYLWNWRNEYQHFFTAITRASRQLVLATTAEDGVGRSSFLSALLKDSDIQSVGHCQLPTNLRDSVAYLRASTTGETVRWGTGNIEPEQAATLLAKLGREGCSPALPKNWIGTLEASGPQEPESEVHIFASGLEGALQNPLDYVLGWFGYSNEEDDPYAPNQVGNIVHKVAQTVGCRHWLRGEQSCDQLEYEEILAELREETRLILAKLQDDTWVENNFKLRVEACLEPLAFFLQGNQYPSLFEASYSAKIKSSSGNGAITYNARIDRVMFTPSGVLLVDYKTGNPAKYTAKNVAANLQLALYQAAYNASEEGQNNPCIAAKIVALQIPIDEDHPSGSSNTAKDRNPKVLLQHGLEPGTNLVTLPQPFSGTHRQLLTNPLAWLRGDPPGKGDPEQMPLGDYFHDRVDLAVAAFRGPNVAQIRQLGSWGNQKPNLPVEVRQK